MHIEASRLTLHQNPGRGAILSCVLQDEFVSQWKDKNGLTHIGILVTKDREW